MSLPLDLDPAVQLVERLLEPALSAPDTLGVHLEPGRADVLRVRVRGPRGLVPWRTLEPAVGLRLVQGLKRLASLDAKETRIPQDGHLWLGARRLRLSVLPARRGEAVLLQRASAEVDLPRDLRALGLDPSDRARVEAALERASGLVLVAGPAGSGKTTLLRACLRHLVGRPRAIVDIPDHGDGPAGIDGITSLIPRPDVQVHARALLFNVLRNDLADGVCFGDLRDHEVAHEVLEAAAMGRLMLATKYAPDAPSAVNRLLDLGVEPWLITGGLSLVIVCRALRRLCDACKVLGPIVSVDDARRLAPRLVEEEVLTEPFATFAPRPHGCAACSGLGVIGRVGVHEVIDRPGELVDALLRAGASFAALHDRARTLREVALLRASAGEVALVEAIASTSHG
jgi:type II secretory ATPase GspE/PulE/Tfp pilus assembly ATPase PilB-like protein